MRKPIKEIILTFKITGNVSLTAKVLGISRPTVYRWILRGTTTRGYVKYIGIKRESTRPKIIHHKLSLALKEQILQIKETRHFGSRKIRYFLPEPVSFMTIQRFLEKKNQINRQANYRRPRFQNGHAMRPSNTKTLGYLQMDTKHVTPELSGLPFTVYEYAAIDIISRYKLALMMPEINDESASLCLKFFLKWFPFRVVYLQTDNGLEYQRDFDLACRDNQINHYFIHKNTPNENAVIERSFKTDQDEFYYWLKEPPKHIGELNEWFQKFILDYNTTRPHQSLNYKTPLEVVKLYQT